MKILSQAKKYGACKLAAGSALFLAPIIASADMLTDAQAALTTAGADALTVGGYVVAALASLIVVGMIISMMRKAG